MRLAGIRRVRMTVLYSWSKFLQTLPGMQLKRIDAGCQIYGAGREESIIFSTTSARNDVSSFGAGLKDTV